jgi:hypothetical protein
MLFCQRNDLLFFILVRHFYSYLHLSVYCHNLQIGLLVYSYACKLFLIAILEGKPRRFEPRPQRLLNYKDTKPWMSSLLVFNRVYRLEIQSVMFVFLTHLVN